MVSDNDIETHPALRLLAWQVVAVLPCVRRFLRVFVRRNRCRRGHGHDRYDAVRRTMDRVLDDGRAHGNDTVGVVLLRSRTQTVSKPEDINDRLREGDASLGVGGLSINESHAFILGVTVGVAARRRRLWTAVAVAIGPPSAIGRRAIKREPWYFAAGLLAGLVGRRVVTR